MNSKQRANIIAWIHFFWILFGISCLPLMFVFDYWYKVALIFFSITVLSWLIFRGCWFLQLENKFRKEHNPAEAFEGQAFIQHYLNKYLKLGCSKLAVRICVYSYLIVLAWVAISKMP